MAQPVFPLTGDISFFSKTHATFIARMIIIWRFFMPSMARIQVTSTTDLVYFLLKAKTSLLRHTYYQAGTYY
jgi:hypothetical protein